VADCFKWGEVGYLWKDGNWAWNYCNNAPPPQPTNCIQWGTADVLWEDADWYWSVCSGSVPVPPEPTASIFVQPPGVDAMTLVQPWLIEPYNPYRAADREQEKKKRFIKLICKIKGQTFEMEKEIGEHEKVSVDDVRMVVRNITGVDLDIKKLEE
jgi:hypothetical protein